MKWPLYNKIPNLPIEGAVGDFGYRRSFYYHPGIDLYCSEGQEICAIEDGEIVNIEHFTGANANPPSPWWNDTWSILIEGKSGVIGYCELKVNDNLKIGSQIQEGQIIASIIPVLKKNKGNGTTMLHLEHYETGTKDHATWLLDTPKSEHLLNPRNLLETLLLK